METSKRIEQMELFPHSYLPGDIPASHSVKPGGVEARMMTGTSGRKCLESFKNAGPIGCLRRMLLDTLNWGSRRCLLTWKVKDISPRFSILELWPKMLPIEECGSGLWLTPRTVQIEPKEGRREKRKAYRESIGRQDYPGCLAEQVATPEMWPTPTQDSVTEREKKYAQGGTPLTMAVKMWPTPSATPRGPHTGAISGSVAEDGKSRVSAKGVRFGATLETAVKMYPTPTTRDYKGGYKTESLTRKDGKSRAMDLLPNAVLEGKGTETVKGSLSPDWVEHYLMGYPLGWTNLTSQESE